MGIPNPTGTGMHIAAALASVADDKRFVRRVGVGGAGAGAVPMMVLV